MSEILLINTINLQFRITTSDYPVLHLQAFRDVVYGCLTSFRNNYMDSVRLHGASCKITHLWHGRDTLYHNKLCCIYLVMGRNQIQKHSSDRNQIVYLEVKTKYNFVINKPYKEPVWCSIVHIIEVNHFITTLNKGESKAS